MMIRLVCCLCLATVLMAAESPLARWYAQGEVETAIALARHEGRPLLYMLIDDEAVEHLHHERVEAWKQDTALFGAFVKVIVPWKARRECAPFTAVEKAAPDLGRFVPRIYFATVDNGSLGGIPTKADREQTVAAVRTAIAAHGGVLSTRLVAGFWKDIGRCREAREADERERAVAALDDALHRLRKTPRHPLRAEVRSDIDAIRPWADEALAAAQAIEDAAERARSLRALRRTYRYILPADE